jgi:hypothetical protein
LPCFVLKSTERLGLCCAVSTENIVYFLLKELEKTEVRERSTTPTRVIKYKSKVLFQERNCSWNINFAFRHKFALKALELIYSWNEKEFYSISKSHPLIHKSSSWFETMKTLGKARSCYCRCLSCYLRQWKTSKWEERTKENEFIYLIFFQIILSQSRRKFPFFTIFLTR